MPPEFNLDFIRFEWQTFLVKKKHSPNLSLLPFIVISYKLYPVTYIILNYMQHIYIYIYIYYNIYSESHHV